MKDNENLVREKSSNALLNNDLKAFEEYKFKKNLLRDINNLKTALDDSIEIINNMSVEIEKLNKRIEVLENSKGEK